MVTKINSHYDSIISIHLSKKVSGTFQSGLNASKKIKVKNIEVIDSYNASVGLGLLAMYAVDLKRDGKSYNQIISMVRKKREKTSVFLVLDDLKYIVKGGRLPSKIKAIADLFRLRPVIGTKNEGQLKARGVLWGRSRMEFKFAEFLNTKLNEGTNYRIMIAHANALKKGNKLLELLLSKHSNIKEHFIVELGGALGAHSGPNALSIGIQEIN